MFLENHREWLHFQSESVQAATRFVDYTTDMNDYKNVLQDEGKLAEFFDSLPSEVRNTKWDAILVDAPMGMVDGFGRPQPGVPGRMQSVSAALRLAHEDAVIFVDDYQRTVEQESAEVLLKPHAWDHAVYDNGHGGKTAMFVMQPKPDQRATTPNSMVQSADLFPCKGTPDPEQQLSGKVLQAICKKIQKSGAKFLVFGLGRDSSFWYENADQQNVMFLENHREWLHFQSESVQAATRFVDYTTDMNDYKNVLQDEGKLAEFFDSLPSEVRNTKWDAILVDAPMGMVDGFGRPQPGVPGRMQSVSAALRLAHEDAVIFVDDYQRTVEQESAEVLLKPHAWDHVVYDNGHSGKTAMFVMSPRQ